MNWVDWLMAISGYGVCFYLGLLCAVLLLKVYQDKINLSKLLDEANGSASMSRFQLLIFTLIVAISLFLVVVYTKGLPVIPPSILMLLGISASTYAVSKGISYSRDEGVTTPEARAAIRGSVTQMSNTGAAAAATSEGIISTGASDPAPMPGASTPPTP
jgi:cytosine/uracil/thiamine/allantoin permease